MLKDERPDMTKLTGAVRILCGVMCTNATLTDLALVPYYCQTARNLIRKLMFTLHMSGNMRHGIRKLWPFFGDVTPCGLA